MKRTIQHKLIQKAVCPRCRRFLGLITSDGVPLMDECPEGHDQGSEESRRCSPSREPCPMYDLLAQFAPPARRHRHRRERRPSPPPLPVPPDELEDTEWPDD